MAILWRQAPPSRPIAALLIAAALPVHACWDEAAARYQVSSVLLQAIARTESGLDPRAVGHNRDGSRDIGLMQINSGWLPTLARHGIREADLFDPCLSIHVGAWILAQNIARLGYTWEAVGAYNASAPQLHAAYVERVRRHLPPDTGRERTSAPTAVRPASVRTHSSTALHP